MENLKSKKVFLYISAKINIFDFSYQKFERISFLDLFMYEFIYSNEKLIFFFLLKKNFSLSV